MKKKIQGTRSNFFHFSTSNQVCMPVFFQLDISFEPQFKQKNVKKTRIYYLFCFLACSGGFLWERAPKLMDYLIFWAYWTKNQSHCPIRFDELFSYSLSWVMQARRSNLKGRNFADVKDLLESRPVAIFSLNFPRINFYGSFYSFVF